MQASASYVTGSQAIKIGFQDSWGPYNQTLRANADLYQNYLTNAQGIPAPATVTLLATPSHWQDKLNANLGIYGQDVLTFKHATITRVAGNTSANRSPDRSQIGRFVNIRLLPTSMPIWKNSPRSRHDDVSPRRSRLGYKPVRRGGDTSRLAPTTRRPGIINAPGNNTATNTRTATYRTGPRCNFAAIRPAKSTSPTFRPISA
jgi:hypothetical protein